MVDRPRPRSRSGKNPPSRIKGIIEKWAYELLKNYNQDQAAKNLVDINTKLLDGLSVDPGDWGYYSLEIGKYPQEKLAKIKSGLPLPPGARGIIIDAGYSVSVIITGEPIRRTLRRYKFYRLAFVGLLGPRPIGGRARLLKRRRGAQANSRRTAALLYPA